MRVQDKVIVVTGAASGMGLAMAQRFTQEGARVVAADLNAGRLDAAVRGIQAAGGAVVPFQGSMAEQAVAEGVIDVAVREFGRLDALVNNAGIMDYMAAVGDVTNEVWERVLAVNLHGPMYAMRRAVQQMLSQETPGGSIVNVGSTASLSGGAAGAAYTTSKHALLGLTREDKAGMAAQHARNYRFFDAPVGLIFTIDRVMQQGSWLDYGMFLENIMIAARGRGLDTCPQAAFTQFHRIIGAELGLAPNEMVVCGMALGHADPDKIENTLVTEREPLASFVRFLD